jgi:hypothetical protein
MARPKLECHRIPVFVVRILGRPSYLELLSGYLELLSGSKEELGEEVAVERQRQFSLDALRPPEADICPLKHTPSLIVSNSVLSMGRIGNHYSFDGTVRDAGRGCLYTLVLAGAGEGPEERVLAE